MSRIKSKTVFVGMSGGVDSSVAALLLARAGYEVIGVFLRCYNLDGCAERDAEDARRVAERIGIPFYVWDFEEEYRRRVVDYMVEGYRAGVTPNPDVMCNKEIKFGLFLQRALAMGADFVATGHYVRLKRSKTMRGLATALRPLNRSTSHGFRSLLFAAKDKNKDQSYFLWTLTQRELARCLFPIGNYLKSEVRAIARKAGLPTAKKKDSQGICFLGKVSVADFLKRYIPERRGALMTTRGERIGEHFGAEFYTIGQRHLDADFQFPKTGKRADREPFYVVSKDAATNTITVAEGADNEALYRKEITLTDVHIINPASRIPHPASPVHARVRYRQPLAKAKLIFKKDFASLVFARPQRFVASGQSAVWYSKNGEMLGGGVIL